MNERQLRQYQSIAPTIKALRDSPDLTTKAGAREYIANGSQYDDVLFSKSFKLVPIKNVSTISN